jgi:D-beta-D-heptose 7-phosphate kinase/D-beta-D-heptose 1-phosphate adenosyltransferase
MSGSAALVPRLAGKRIAVVGDVMLDHFLIGAVDRISPEAPVPVVRFTKEEFRLGGAANVAHNIVALSGHAAIVGLCGDDAAASTLSDLLRRAGLDAQGLVTAPGRPTTRKMRIVTSRNQQVARIDYEVDTAPGGDVVAALRAAVGRAAIGADAIVISDYRKGAVTDDVIAAAVNAGQHRAIPILVDPKVAQPDRYKGTTLITPNHHEAELMTQTTIRVPQDAREAARLLHHRTGANVLITWGEHGMWVFDGGGSQTVERALPAMAREVADVTGAGDTVIAVLALALAAGASLVDAAELANIAAGLVVARFGPASVTPPELLAAAAADA